MRALLLLLLAGCASESRVDNTEEFWRRPPCPEGSELVWAGGAQDCIEVIE